MAWLTPFLVLWAIYEHSLVCRISSVPMYHFFIYIPLPAQAFSFWLRRRAKGKQGRKLTDTFYQIQLRWMPNDLTGKKQTNKQTTTTATTKPCWGFQPLQNVSHALLAQVFPVAKHGKIKFFSPVQQSAICDLWNRHFKKMQTFSPNIKDILNKDICAEYPGHKCLMLKAVK